MPADRKGQEGTGDEKADCEADPDPSLASCRLFPDPFPGPSVYLVGHGGCIGGAGPAAERPRAAPGQLLRSNWRALEGIVGACR